MRTETKYLRFVMAEQKAKTQVWQIISKKWGDVLGVIRWYGPWRQYIFYPEKDTIWNKDCLDDVKIFLQDLMERRKKDERSRNLD